ncbi:MAG: beta-L-arabinofuranosidase domain-containing protein [Acidobacteriota bacterium]
MHPIRTGFALALLCAAAATAGDLTDRYQLALHRVLAGGPPAYSHDFILKDVIPEHVRRFTEYSGDVSGRYVDALSAAAGDLNTAFPALDALVPKILALQKPGGYFGGPFHVARLEQNDMALLWGNGRLLIGLLENYRYKPAAETLAAARRLGEFLLEIGPTLNSDAVRRQFETGAFASGYICWTQQVEALARLFELTKDPRYRDLADTIAARIERKPSEHSHGFLASVRGLVELYRVTGDRKYLESAERDWQEVVDSGNLLLPGTIPEAWRPAYLRTEGCAEADWLRLSLALWQLTGNAKYIEAAERTLFNELAMNQFETGDFGHRLLSPTGVAGHQAARAWWCCTLHGLRSFPEALRSAFREHDGALAYDLAIDGRGRAGSLSLTADSTLGRDASVLLKVTAAAGKAEPLDIRKPAWARRVAISLNGKPLAANERNGYLRATHAWKTGDRLTVKYDMITQTVANPETRRIALFHGPWLLGIDEASNPYYFDEPSHENRLQLTPELEPAPAAGAGKFAVPVARFRVTYLPGGYKMLPSRATLRPVAEQTGTRTTNWEFWFQTAR